MSDAVRLVLFAAVSMLAGFLICHTSSATTDYYYDDWDCLDCGTSDGGVPAEGEYIIVQDGSLTYTKPDPCITTVLCGDPVGDSTVYCVELTACGPEAR